MDQRVAKAVRPVRTVAKVTELLPARVDTGGTRKVRLGGHDTRIKRTGGSHDLKGGARRVETLGGAVEERRAGVAEGLLEARVWIERRRRRHHENATVAWIEHDDAAPHPKLGQLVHRNLLRRRVETQDNLVTTDGVALQAIERVDDASQVACATRQLWIERAFETRAASEQRRVAHQLRSQPACRIVAEVDGATVERAGLGLGERDTIGRDDRAAVDCEVAVDEPHVGLPRLE